MNSNFLTDDENLEVTDQKQEEVPDEDIARMMHERRCKKEKKKKER
jgi:hypothetical protein